MNDLQRALADYAAETLAQVPPGYRLVDTEMKLDPAGNRYVLVSTWEPQSSTTNRAATR